MPGSKASVLGAAGGAGQHSGFEPSCTRAAAEQGGRLLVVGAIKLKSEKKGFQTATTP